LRAFQLGHHRSTLHRVADVRLQRDDPRGNAWADVDPIRRTSPCIVRGGGRVASQSIVPNAATTTAPISHRENVLPFIGILVNILT